MIRYLDIGYVELVVSNLTRSVEFYRDIVGLQYIGTRVDGAALFRCDANPYSVVLHEGTRPGFKRAGWILEDLSQFETLHAHLRAHGARYGELSAQECQARGFGRATRVHEKNTGATLEFYVPADTGVVERFSPTHTQIRRLGHVVFATPRAREALEFFRDVLNFLESDAVGDIITFLRPFPNPYHHGIGIGRSSHPHFHHLNFMVTEIDDIGRALNRFRQQDVTVVFGPGRHPASGSVFLYFLDPDGMTLEYSFGMEKFQEVDPRPPCVLPPTAESLDLWGSIRDPRFATTGEIESVEDGQASQ
jgi:2,3-dihydroxy-p-cumate/2,3-dihydroxybenzoate 3,4-dioxygenase